MHFRNAEVWRRLEEYNNGSRSRGSLRMQRRRTSNLQGNFYYLIF